MTLLAWWRCSLYSYEVPSSFIVSCSLPFSALPLFDEQHERHLVRKKEQNQVVVIVIYCWYIVPCTGKMNDHFSGVRGLFCKSTLEISGTVIFVGQLSYLSLNQQCQSTLKGTLSFFLHCGQRSKALHRTYSINTRISGLAHMDARV